MIRDAIGSVPSWYKGDAITEQEPAARLGCQARPISKPSWAPGLRSHLAIADRGNRMSLPFYKAMAAYKSCAPGLHALPDALRDPA